MSWEQSILQLYSKANINPDILPTMFLNKENKPHRNEALITALERLFKAQEAPPNVLDIGGGLLCSAGVMLDMNARKVVMVDVLPEKIVLENLANIQRLNGGKKMEIMQASGDSRKVLSRLFLRNKLEFSRFDMALVDGAADVATKRLDIEGALRLTCAGGAVLVRLTDNEAHNTTLRNYIGFLVGEGLCRVVGEFADTYSVPVVHLERGEGEFNWDALIALEAF